MPSKFSALSPAKFLDVRATPRGLAMALIVAVACQIVMAPLDMRLHALSGGLVKPSLVFAADGQAVLDRLRAFGGEGRRLLAWSYAVDLVFPIAVAATCIQAFWLAFRRIAPTLTTGLSLAALAFWLLDLAEKISSFYVLARFPAVDERVADVAADLTTVKLVCLAITYAGLLGAVATCFVRLLRR